MPMAIFKWPGGKARLANKIVSLFPPPDAYSVFLDVFGGAANVTLAVPDRPDLLKIYNDVDSELVNLFRVMRDPAARERLIDMLTWTPYSRQEYAEAITFEPADQVEKAWRFFVLTEQSYSGISYSRATPGRWGYTVTAGKQVARAWVNSVDSLHEFGQRLRSVQVENLDYREAVRRYDGPDVLIYADPPYLVRHCPDEIYVNEMQDVEAHRELAEVLNSVKGMVVLSGYPSEEYRERYDERGWERHEFDVVCSTSCRSSRVGLKGLSKPRRTECVWLNPAAVRARERARPVQMSLADLGVGF